MDAAEGSAARLKGQVDDLSRQLNELSSLKARLTQENFDLQSQVQELDSTNAALAKARSQLQNQNDDLRRQLDDESRVRWPPFWLRRWFVFNGFLSLSWRGGEKIQRPHGKSVLLKRDLFCRLQQRQNLQVSLVALQSDYDNLNARLEEEAETSANLRTQYSKISAEYAALKTRFDKELAARTEELEDTR